MRERIRNTCKMSGKDKMLYPSSLGMKEKMKMNKKFGEWLFSQLSNKGWSARELGRRAGIASTSITRVISGETSPTFEFCTAIAKPLQETPVKVFELAGLLPAGYSEDPTYHELLSYIQTLTPNQRLDILKYVRFVLSQSPPE